VVGTDNTASVWGRGFLTAGKVSAAPEQRLLNIAKKENIMNFLDQLKSVAELITTVATASVVIKHLFEQYYPIKRFFKIKVPLFFKGERNIDGKKVRFFKALKLEHERRTNILEAVAPDYKAEEVLILDKKALLDIISESGAFYKTKLRKK
jgi:hypothetical protein